MKTADKSEFARILTGLAAIKPGVKLTPEALDVYWLALEDWPLSEFKAAASHLAKTSEFMPNPYHFEQLRKVLEDSPAEAWCKVLDAVRRMRPFDVVNVDARTDRVVRAMGGYRQLGMTDSDEMHFREKRFAELWEELGSVDDTRAALPFLNAGQHDGPRTLFSSFKVADTFAQPENQIVPHGKARA